MTVCPTCRGLLALVILAMTAAIAAGQTTPPNSPQITTQSTTRIQTAGGTLATGTYPLDGPNHITLTEALRPARLGVNFVHATDLNQAYPVRINGWWGLMDRRGRLIVYPRYDWIDRPTHGLARAVRDGKTGYINVTGNVQVPLRFPWADRFAESFAVVGDGKGKFGYIDLRGKVVVPVRLDGALRYREGFAAVRVDGKCGFIDAAGNVVIQPQWAAVRSFHNGLAAVRAFDPDTGEPGRWGYIRSDGQRAFADRSGRITQLGDFHEGFARVRAVVDVDGQPAQRWGYLDRKFDWVIRPRFVNARDFHDGVAAVAEHTGGNTDPANIKWGLINTRGDLTVPAVLQGIDDLSETLALIAHDGQFGYVNRNASAGIKPVFEKALPFDDQLARVHPTELDASGVTGFAWIDTSGRVVWDPRAPHVAILDLTNRGQALAQQALKDRSLPQGNRQIKLPPQRDPLPEAYPPEFLYEEQLPTPELVSPLQPYWR